MLETEAGLLPVERVSDSGLHRRHGPAAPRLERDPPARSLPDTRTIALDTSLPEAPELQGPSAVSMGNPHAIFWVDDALAYDLAAIGPVFENDPALSRARQHLASRKCRAPSISCCGSGSAAPALTRACGSAACATLVAAARKGLTGRKAAVTLPGGDLVIEWRESDDHVLMTGPIELEHEGTLSPALFAEAA